MEPAAEYSVCMENIRIDSRSSTLHCGHSLFMDFTNSLINKLKYISCPEDKQNFVIPTIKPNFEMLSMIELCNQQYHKTNEELKSTPQYLQLGTQNSKKERNCAEDKLLEEHKQEISNAMMINEEKELKNIIKEQESKIKEHCAKELRIKIKNEGKKRETETEKTKKIENEEDSSTKMKVDHDLKSKFIKEQPNIFENTKNKKTPVQNSKNQKTPVQQSPKKSLETQNSSQPIKPNLPQTSSEQAQIIEKELREHLEAKLIKFQSLATIQQIERELHLQHFQIPKTIAATQARKDSIKKLLKEKMANAQLKVKQKIRSGKLPGNISNQSTQESMQRDTNRIYWAFKTPRGYYLEYIEDYSTIIEIAFAKNEDYAWIGSGKVVFDKWREVKETGEEVMIKRVNCVCGIGKWRFREGGRWEEFSVQDIIEIEKGWVGRKENCMVMGGKFLDFRSLTVLVQKKELPVVREVFSEEVMGN